MSIIGTQKLRRRLRAARLWLGPPYARVNEYEARISSQNGEDGILREIFRCIGPRSRYLVEFGVGDGSECNGAHLVQQHWSGLMMESDAFLFARLAERHAGTSGVQVANQFIGAENAVAIFEEQGVPLRFDLLSIDVDGNDYWIWRALASYRPRVVVIEYNAAHPPPERWVMAYDPHHRWDGTDYYGASLSSLAALGKELGYGLIGTDAKGVNAFFLERDLLHRPSRLRLGFPELTPERAYHPPGFLNDRGTVGHPPGSGPFERI